MTTNKDNIHRLGQNESDIPLTTQFSPTYTQATLFNAYQTPNNITFHTSSEPILELRENGDIYVQGRLAENDIEVVNAMRTFLSRQGLL